MILVTVALLAVVSNKPIIETDSCSGCGDCVGYCPVKAISMVNNKAIIDADKCINCKICLSVCQQNAIK